MGAGSIGEGVDWLRAGDENIEGQNAVKNAFKSGLTSLGATDTSANLAYSAAELGSAGLALKAPIAIGEKMWSWWGVQSKNTWYSTGFTGSIVDKEGRGIPNAEVMITWQLRSFVNDFPYVFHLSESRSDSQGKFAFKGWGPDFSPTMFATLRASEPIVWVVASGYVPLYQSSAYPNLRFSNLSLNATPKSKKIRIVLEKIEVPVREVTKSEVLTRGGLARDLRDIKGRCVWNNARNFERTYKLVEEQVDPLFHLFDHATDCSLQR